MPRPIPALALAALLPFAAVAQETRIPEAFQLGLGLQQRGLHKEAEGQFAAFLAQHADHALVAEAEYRRAVSLIELHEAPAAIAALRRALERASGAFPLRPECRYRLANLLRDAGEVQPATEELGRLLAELPETHYLLASAHYGLGECRRDLGDDAAALQGFEAALRVSGADAAALRFPALYQAGFAALRLGRAPVALEHFGAAASVTDDAAARHECRFLAGDAALRAGLLDDAQRWLEQGRQTDGEFADDCDLALGFVAVARGDAQALALFRAFGDRHPRSPLRPRAQLEVGRLCYQQQDHAAAEAALLPLRDVEDAALQQAARELLGLCALGAGRGEAAIEPLTGALQAASAGERPRLSFALAEALAAAGRFEAALAPYATAAGATDEAMRGDALYGRCFALHELGRHDESSACAEQLCRELPRHRLAAKAMFALGENAYAQQQYAAAEPFYAAVPTGSEPRTDAEFKLAWCCYLRGDRGGAGKQFLAIAGVAQHPHAEEALSMAALSQLEASDADAALRSADAYRTRYPQGRFLDRTERIAARVLRARGDLAGAAQRLGNAGKVSKDGGADQLEQADLHFQRGDFAAAAASYEPLAARDDEVGARAVEGLAWCAFELGDDTVCAARLKVGQAHARADTIAAALLELASALHHRQQDWPAAIAAAQQFLLAHATHPRAAAMRQALGVAQARSGAHADARRTLAALAEEDGEQRERALYELAWACRRDGDEPAALAAFARLGAVGQDQDLVGEARLHVGTAMLARGELDGARRQLGDVQGRYRGRALYLIGFHDFEAAAADPKRLASAEHTFRELAELPGDELAPEAVFLCGECRRRAGDAAAAGDRYRAFLAASPEHPRAALARLCLAEAAVQLGDGDTAVEQGQRFLAGDPKDQGEAARAHLALGRGRQLRGEHERAEAPLQRATELSEGAIAAEAQFRIGECRMSSSNLAGAVEAFVKLPILYTHAEWVQKGLLQAGLCCERLQQPDKARRFFDELVQRFPDSKEAEAAKARANQKQ